MKRLAWLLGLIALTSVAAFAGDNMKMSDDHSMVGWQDGRDYSYKTPNQMVNERHKRLYELWDAEGNEASSDGDIHHARVKYLWTASPSGPAVHYHSMHCGMCSGGM